MNIESVKANKWKIFSLVIIGLFVLTVVAGYAMRKDRPGYGLHRPSPVQLSDDEKQKALDVARAALEGKITDEFTPQISDFGFEIEKESGETTLVFVSFSSATGDRAYRVAVDLDTGEAVLIMEARGWMAAQHPGSPPPHGSWPLRRRW